MLTYRADIDGLRAIAVLSVLFYHLNHAFLPGGFIGVDIFFVISGFLLSLIIFKGLESDSFSFGDFYKRRIKRILPAFFFMCLVTLIVSYFILLPSEFPYFFKSLRATTYFYQNHFFGKNTGGYWDLDAQEMPLLHTWSLAVEEQFYIILPLMLFMLYKFRFKLKHIAIFLAIIALASFSLSQFYGGGGGEYSGLHNTIQKYNYYILPTRAGELLIGTLIAALSFKIPNKLPSKINNFISILAFIGLAASLIFINENKVLFPSYWAALPTLCAGILIYTNVFYTSSGTNFGDYSCKETLRQTLIAKCLSFAPFVFVGKISYSLYLWHWIVLVFYNKWHTLNFDTKLATLDYVGIIVLSFVAAILSYYAIERPGRHNSLNLKKAFLFFYAVPVFVIWSIYFVDKHTDISNKIYDKFSIYDADRLKEYRIISRYAGGNPKFCNGRLLKNEQGDECVFGDVSKPPKILVIGDSHAGHFTPFVISAGKMYGFSAKIISQGLCLPYLETSQRLNKHQKSKECADFVDKFKREFLDFDVVIFIARWVSYSDEYYREDLSGVVDMLLRAGKKVVMFAQGPELNSKAYDRYVKFFVKNQTYNKQDILSGGEKARNEMVKGMFEDRVIWYDPFRDLGDRYLPPFYDGLIIHTDADHLNLYGVESIAREVLPKHKEFWEGLLR